MFHLPSLKAPDTLEPRGQRLKQKVLEAFLAFPYKSDIPDYLTHPQAQEHFRRNKTFLYSILLERGSQAP